MTILKFYGTDVKGFSISSCFEPIYVVTLCTPQLHSTYHQPQVSSIYLMRVPVVDPLNPHGWLS